jgi:hypothetical protein
VISSHITLPPGFRDVIPDVLQVDVVRARRLGAILIRRNLRHDLFRGRRRRSRALRNERRTGKHDNGGSKQQGGHDVLPYARRSLPVP